MPKKCQPGVICIENVTLFFITIIIFVLVYYFYKINQKKGTTMESFYQPLNNCGLYSKPSMVYSNQPGNVLLNPFYPPLKNADLQIHSSDIRGVVPINVQTRGYTDTSYGQVGILTRVNGPEMILPLMGRRLYSNRDKWQYYCISDQNNSIKLPVSYNGKNCTGEYGCDNLHNGDTIYVEGYNSVFKVTIYENDSPRYIPII